MCSGEDDDDLGSIFRAMKQHRQKKHQDNRDNAPEILEREKIQYTSHNHGTHLVVRAYGWVVDFWPGTGRWIFRDTIKFHGFDIFSMIKRLKENKRADE